MTCIFFIVFLFRKKKEKSFSERGLYATVSFFICVIIPMVSQISLVPMLELAFLFRWWFTTLCKRITSQKLYLLFHITRFLKKILIVCFGSYFLSLYQWHRKTTRTNEKNCASSSCRRQKVWKRRIRRETLKWNRTRKIQSMEATINGVVM